MRTIRPWLIAFGVSLLLGCNGSSLEPEGATVRWGTSFGMCAGYCRQQLEVHGNFVRLTQSSHDTVRYPTRVEERPLTPDVLSGLLNGVDAEDVKQLPEVIGCPDCADGGAEWVELETSSLHRKVTFEFSKDPKELDVLLDRIRALRQQFPSR